MPKFVKMCRNNYTVVNNSVVQNTSLGATERGVLVTILSLPADWDYSIKGLAKLFPDGERKIGTSLKKIEEAGYLKRVRIYSNGKISDWEYQFSDEPIFLPENKEQSSNTCDEDNKSTPESNLVVEKYVENSVNVENNVESNVENPSDNLHCQNSNVENNTPEKSLDCCFVDVGFEDVGFEDVENVHLQKSNDNKINNNKINNNKLLSNQSILSHHPSESKRKQSDVENFSDEIDEIDEMDMEQVISDVEEQIYVERLRSEHNPALINEIIEVIASVFISKQKYRTISGEKVSIELIRKRLKQLEYEHVDYVLMCLQKNTTKIKNRKNYLLTCLYNAPVSIDGYYENLFNHNYGNS